ncbi:hypothetical protein [Jejuia pallidilutea]|uniref:Class I SAM-dependent methyltransferase n=1 Tax=Jejuia pallidilutea TaxID=504487 RepID=A0A090VUG9_9FLAO|nr:hypothetical protein [Jejuia pallidilutea]GAL67628.1 hypothetical protein JCM19301_915 [Jejuia pallidilutea]GAL89444.1 hypothetical protein JCM19538_1439 [Jejuia pallidilutea]
MKKIIRVIREQVKLQRLSYLQLKELEWAHIFHDSIRGKSSLEKLPLNIGRWAGNYAFFYVLHRILSDFKPQNILEFGLGESTKFTSTFIDNYIGECHHIIIEHSKEWENLFTEKFSLSNNSEIKIIDLVEKQHKGFTYKGYSNIEAVITKTFDVYIIDGPLGSSRYSRFDIISLAKKLNSDNQFIILFDDYERHSEKETVHELLDMLEKNNIPVKTKEFIGNKSVFVIATSNYKYITSI